MQQKEPKCPIQLRVQILRKVGRQAYRKVKQLMPRKMFPIISSPPVPHLAFTQFPVTLTSKIKQKAVYTMHTVHLRG
jgi:hypothetical protein